MKYRIQDRNYRLLYYFQEGSRFLKVLFRGFCL